MKNSSKRKFQKSNKRNTEKIEQIIIKNFQSHSNSNIKVSPYLTIIWGDSDAGKSSIIRAIKWVVENRSPKGTFIKQDEQSAEVRLKIGGKEIVRRKSPKENIYKIGEHKYKAVRTDVPEDVAEILRISKVNIQNQNEVYFLIDKTPGEVGKQLNEVAGLSIVDAAIKETNARIREVKNKQNVHFRNTEELKRKLYDLVWVEEASKKLFKIEQLNEKIEKEREEYSYLKQSIFELLKISEEIQTYPSKNFCSAVYRLLKKYEKIEEIQIIVNNLQDIIDSILNLKKEQKKIKIINITSLKNSALKYQQLEEQIQDIERLIKEAKRIKTQIYEAVQEIKQVDTLFHKKFDILKICPLCKRKI